MEYNRADELISAGYQAAQAKAAPLNTLSVDELTWQAYLTQRSSRRLTSPVPQFVEVVGTSPKSKEAIEKDLKNNIGTPVDTERLQNQLMTIKGNGRFSNLSYQMTTSGGEPGLLITGVEKPYSPPIVQPLLLFDGSNFSGVDFSMGARITFLDFGSYRSELRNDLILGSQYGINSQYYRPFSATSNWFIAPNAFANYTHIPLYQGSELVAQYSKTAAGGGVEIGYEFGRVAQLTLGYTAAFNRYVPKIGNEELLPTASGRLGSTALRFALNDVDNPVIPRSGQYVDLVGQWLDANPGAAHPFPVAEGRAIKFIKLNQPSSIYFGARGGTAFGNQLIGVPQFLLGGSNGFAAYGQNELLTDQYYLFQSGYLVKMVKLPPLLGEGVYFNGTFEAGKVFAPPFKSQVPGDIVGALLVNTIFGPIELGGAVGTAGHQRVFFKLGRIF